MHVLLIDSFYKQIDEECKLNCFYCFSSFSFANEVVNGEFSGVDAHFSMA